MTTEIYHNIRLALAEIIKGTMWENHVFFVGGCVRDEMMQTEIHDIDLAVDLPNGGIRFAIWLKKKKLLARGRSLQTFIHFGTAKVKLRQFPKEEIDCVQTRKDRYVYEEHPQPAKNFGSVEEDAIRRDLTINALYLNISTDELLDPTGMGCKDIEQHTIRTPNNPDVTLTDNPMHILRCIRFATKYDWELSAGLIEGLKRNVNILQEATLNRMTKELASILVLPQKELALKRIEEIGAMPYVYPFLALAQLRLDNPPSEESPRPHHHHRDGQNRKRKRHYHTKKAKKTQPQQHEQS